MPVLPPCISFVCVCVPSFLCTVPNCSFCSFILSSCLVFIFNSFFPHLAFSPDETNRLPCCVLCFLIHKIFTSPPGVVFHTSLSVVEACLSIDYVSGAVEKHSLKVVLTYMWHVVISAAFTFWHSAIWAKIYMQDLTHICFPLMWLIHFRSYRTYNT